MHPLSPHFTQPVPPCVPQNSWPMRTNGIHMLAQVKMAPAVGKEISLGKVRTSIRQVFYVCYRKMTIPVASASIIRVERWSCSCVHADGDVSPEKSPLVV